MTEQKQFGLSAVPEGVEHGPYLPMNSSEEAKMAKDVYLATGYLPKVGEDTLLQEAYQLEMHDEAVAKAAKLERIDWLEESRRRDNIYSALRDIENALQNKAADEREREEHSAYINGIDEDDANGDMEAGSGTTSQERVAATYFDGEDDDFDDDEDEDEDPLAGDVEPSGGYDETEYVDLLALELNEDENGNIVDGYGRLVYPEDELLTDSSEK